MSVLPRFTPAPGRTLTLAGAPEGHDARLLAEFAAQQAEGVVHIALDDGRMTRLADLVGFYAPDLEDRHNRVKRLDPGSENSKCTGSLPGQQVHRKCGRRRRPIGVGSICLHQGLHYHHDRDQELVLPP